MHLNVHFDLQAHGVKLLRSFWSHTVASSSLRLPIRTAQVARLSASFVVLPAGLAAVAHSSQSSCLFRQVSCVFSRLVLLRAPLALRQLSHSSPGELPVNKSLKSDKVKPSCLLQKGAKATPAPLRALAQRY
jgi:hypothetical protein